MNLMDKDKIFMKEAIRLSEMAVEHGNEPFGAVLVKDGDIVYTNENQIYTAAETDVSRRDRTYAQILS